MNAQSVTHEQLLENLQAQYRRVQAEHDLLSGQIEGLQAKRAARWDEINRLEGQIALVQALAQGRQAAATSEVAT